MTDCCMPPSISDYSLEDVIQLAPCPPPWMPQVLFERGELNNLSRAILDNISSRCQRQVALRSTPAVASSCVDECKIATTLTFAGVIFVFLIGIIIWRFKSRRRRRRPRVRKINPVLDLKNKIELSIITMDDDSTTSSGSSSSEDSFKTGFYSNWHSLNQTPTTVL